MRKRLVLVVLIVVLALAAATAAGARTSSFPGFRMPSKNIACAYIADRSAGGPLLRCDLLSGLRPEPTRACDFDWGAIFMRPRKKARAGCISDTVYDKRAPILAYGRTWSRGAFRCQSARKGLTCRSGTHGLFLARQSWRVW
jgi:hypothetical protein